MKKDLWSQVKDMVEQGKCPEIKLFEEQEIKPAKQKRGRPPNLPEEHSFKHYLGKALKPDVVRPFCYRRGCPNALRVNQPVACSEFCEAQIILEIELVLTLLKRRKVRIPKAKASLIDSQRKVS
jgi:hypothetical protein